MSNLTLIEALFPKEMFGCIIGEKGSNIKEVREKNNVKVHTDKDASKGTYRKISLEGDWCNIWNALCEIIKTVNEGIEDGRLQTENNTGMFQIMLKIPTQIAGAVIGKGGANLNEWRQRWADGEFHVDNDETDPIYRYLRIKAVPYTMCEASVQIAEVIENSLQKLETRGGKGIMQQQPGMNRSNTMMGMQQQDGMMGGGIKRGRDDMGMGSSPFGNMPHDGGMKKQRVEPNELEVLTTILMDGKLIGRIIGQGGSTIKGIRTASGCSITTDRDGERPDRKREVQISGTLEAVGTAITLVQQNPPGNPQGLPQGGNQGGMMGMQNQGGMGMAGQPLI